ncbi:hypothetical protein RvY_16911-2 [Ramazzottius varieornatus]|uniref:Post-GPI attachment to proteins factor 3 n=1 Tax=Ramazzottius varieornatus TaxID=947166 RepID=A0A1D1W072_RAMVA|nr:hypothetical protein RvY_16911-2 [Ramazzottius varieornatus]
MASNIIFTVSCILLALTGWSDGSMGDRSNYFRTCLLQCSQANCPSSAFFVENDLPDASWARQQPWYMKAFLWECEDECKYNCMWDTVDRFRENNYSIPQFYGKVR